MSTESIAQEPALVSLTIPCRAEYVGVARLAILGVASRLNFSYDEVEDLRLAVGEACTGAIDRAAQSSQPPSQIAIECDIQPSELNVAVMDSIHRDGSAKTAGDFALPTGDPDNIGALLMEILVDKVDVAYAANQGTTVRLKKKVHLS